MTACFNGLVPAEFKNGRIGYPAQIMPQVFQFKHPSSIDVQFRDYQDLRSRLVSRELTCEQVIEAYLQRIESHRDDNIFTAVFHDAALQRARDLDAKLARGEAIGKLFGMPVAIKDNIAMAGAPLTCASKILKGYESVYDATAVQRLSAEDAVFVGRTNMDEFAMGSSNENSALGPVPNPFDKTRVPGGSSGGSAAAVANGLAMVALGSDTGGSVRQPAGFCNIVGLKPTYGRISRYGLVAFASSFDQIGILAANSDDAAITLQVMAGKDERDATSSKHEVEEYDAAMSQLSLKGLRVGVPSAFFPEDLNPDVAGVVKAGLKKLEDAGAELVEIELPESDYAIAAYYILVTAEASSNLARFDGARYGYRSPESGDLTSMYVNTRTEGFGAEVKRRIMLGTYVLSAGYYDTYYKKAQQVRRVFQDRYREALEKVDVIAGPTSPFPPFGIGDKMDNPLEMYLADVFTVPASIVGMPAVSVPVGFDSLGLPVGIHLICNFFEEGKMLGIARSLQSLCQEVPSN